MRLKDDLWHNISENTMDLTQKKIEDLLGMDAYTFKTCALIMQDQYGKFMEAKPEDRMDALGYVLGLGIYSDMEKIARNNYTEENRILRDLKEKLSELKQDAEGEEEVSARIESLGKVQEVTALSIEKTSGILEGLMIKQSTLTSKEQELFKSAKKMEEIQKATDDLYDKEEKLETKKESYQAIVDKESDLLIQIDALNKGRENLNKRLKEKAEKQMELKGLEEKRNFLGQLKAKLKSKLAARDLLLDDVKEKEKHQAIMDQLSGVKEELDQYMAREERKIELKRSLEQQDVELRSFQRESTAKEDFYNKQIQALEKKIEIRNNAECIDITKAKCRFLADTIGAEEEIERIKKELENLCAAVEEKKSEHNAKGKRTREEIISLNLSIDEKFRRESDYERYLEAKEKVADLRHTDAALDSITADIKEIQDQIDQAEKASDEQAETTLKNVLATLKSRITDSQAAQIEYERLTPQLEKIPLYKKLIMETDEELNNIAESIKKGIKDWTELDGETAVLRREISEMQDVPELATRYKAELARMQSDQNLNAQRIGAAESELKRILEAKERAAQIRSEVEEAAINAEVMSILVKAFQQEGIPHQIVRDVVPELEAQANDILGRMTGGRMSIEFRLERTVKSTKTDVPTLDIIIYDINNNDLPYMSRSGGQKVRAALAVSFALAMLKAERVGLKLGMLFVDEPSFLDAEGVDAYYSALEAMHEKHPYMKIIGISHDPMLASKFPQQIHIDVTPEGSKIRR